MKDSTEIMAKTIGNFINNPISKLIIRIICNDCKKCGNRLNLFLRKYSGNSVNLCIKCRFLYMISSLIVTNEAKSFRVSKNEMKGYLSDMIFRRGLLNVLKGISYYGITKPQVTYAPFLVVWDWTHMCNLKCKHCYINADKKLESELTTEEAKKLIDELADCGVVALSFAGGEPLIRPDFFEVANYAKQKGFHVSLATNGTLITQKVAKKLKKVGVDYIEISLDGAKAETHDNFRGIHGVFKKTLEGIRNCLKAGLYTCIATTVTKSNFEEIPEIYELAKKLGVQFLIFFNFIPSGRGKNIINLDILPEQRENLLNFIYEKMISSSKPQVMCTAPQLGRICAQKGMSIPTHFFTQDIIGKYAELSEFIGGCGAGRLYCSIEPNGDVQPCVFMPIKIGNIREKPLKEIWHNSKVLEKLRDRSKLKANCSSCEYKFVCGGCRSRAYAYFGDVLAPDPGCINNR